MQCPKKRLSLGSPMLYPTKKLMAVLMSEKNDPGFRVL